MLGGAIPCIAMEGAEINVEPLSLCGESEAPLLLRISCPALAVPWKGPLKNK